ncbi:MAG: alanine racemase [Propionibacteriaceae bacterium]|nr:alanine racemase [Propionibacteriaceae bacterium]
MAMEGFETYAQVDLGALERNLDYIRNHVEYRKILLPIKANAYGHGLRENSLPSTAPVARFLQERNVVDWLGVATVEEGVQLRSAGVTLPILKLSYTQNHELARAITAGLTLTVGDPVSIWAASAAAETLNTYATVHLKVDTGMRRLGCPVSMAARLASLIEESPYLNLEGVFTHFAAAENPDEDDFTSRQIDQFDDALDDIHRSIGREIELKHAANSAAVERHKDAWYDMVRPGILSYGYPQSLDSSVKVRPVMSVISHVSCVKMIHAGESVSYGRTWVAARDTRLATVSIGYGDGYPRSLSNKAEVLIQGKRYPQVGTVCMDHIMVDVGLATKIEVGEQVTIIGRDGSQVIGADDLGRQVDTISYEILCGLTERLSRMYIG